LSTLVDSSNKISPSLSPSSTTSATAAKKDIHSSLAANIDSASIVTMNDLGKFATEVTGSADSIIRPSLNLNEVIQQQLSPFFENVNLNVNNLNALQQQIAVAAATAAVQAANAQQGITNQTATAALLQKTSPVGLNSLLAAQLSAAVAAATAAVVNPTNVASSLSPVNSSAASPDTKSVANNNLSPTLSNTSSGNATNLQTKQQLLSPSNWNNQTSWQHQQQQQQQQQVSPNSLANTNLLNKNENLDEGSAATAAIASVIQQQKNLNLNKIANTTNTLNAVNNLLTQQQQASKLQGPSKASPVNNLLNPLLQQVSSGSNTIQQALNSIYSSQPNISTSNTSASTSNSTFITNSLNTNTNLPNSNLMNATKTHQSAKPTPALSATSNGNFSRLAANNAYVSGADQGSQYEMPLLEEQVQVIYFKHVLLREFQFKVVIYILKDRNNNSVLNTLINTSNLIANNPNSSNNLNSFDMSVLNHQLLDLIRQDPFHIEQILKRKLVFLHFIVLLIYFKYFLNIK
jgi:hypothetical protein